MEIVNEVYKLCTIQTHIHLIYLYSNNLIVTKEKKKKIKTYVLMRECDMFKMILLKRRERNL